MIVKFSYMNECTYEMLVRFDLLDLSSYFKNYKKIMFVPKPMPEFKCAVYKRGYENDEQITIDTFIFDEGFDLYKFLNDGIIVEK